MIKRFFFVVTVSVFIVLGGPLRWAPESHAEDHPRPGVSLPVARLWLRAGLKEGLKNRDKTDELIQYIYEHFSETPEAYPAVILAYYGTLRGLQAKFAGNPQKKVAGLADCLKYLDQAVQKEDADLEVFFLRYSSLHHLPPLLGVPKKRGEDIGTICTLLLKRDYTSIDREFQLEMIDFMLRSKRLNALQRKALEQLQKEL